MLSQKMFEIALSQLREAKEPSNYSKHKGSDEFKELSKNVTRAYTTSDVLKCFNNAFGLSN
jgi:ribosome-binding ATPase YchF (GTP1/OBG family)